MLRFPFSCTHKSRKKAFKQVAEQGFDTEEIKRQISSRLKKSFAAYCWFFGFINICYKYKLKIHKEMLA
jgi:hypothetical protein